MKEEFTRLGKIAEVPVDTHPDVKSIMEQINKERKMELDRLT